MANCMICNEEFDPEAGTSRRFCPRHCAPVPGKPAPVGGAAVAAGRRAVGLVVVFFGSIVTVVVSVILFAKGSFGWSFVFFLVALVVLSVVSAATGLGSAGPAGAPNSAMICPHCQTKGSVTAVPIRRKVGVSGGKATAAILTGGVSLLATGLSRKESATRAHCSHCGANWVY
jgi:hypothetical protein